MSTISIHFIQVPDENARIQVLSPGSSQLQEVFEDPKSAPLPQPLMSEGLQASSIVLKLHVGLGRKKGLEVIHRTKEVWPLHK